MLDNLGQNPQQAALPDYSDGSSGAFLTNFRKGKLMRAIELTSAEGKRYLSGEAFADYGKFTAPHRLHSGDRISCLVDIVRGKKVLHVGFCDHQPLLQDRIDSGLWLHQHFVAAATRCVGLDIDQAAVENVRKVTGLADIFCADVTQPGIDVIGSEQWDYVVFADVLEHIPDSARFLRLFLENYGRHVPNVVISVPNCQRMGVIRGALSDFEMINSDHKVEYSLFTLAKLIDNANLVEPRFFYCGYANIPAWKRFLISRFPRLSDSLIVSARVPSA